MIDTHQHHVPGLDYQQVQKRGASENNGGNEDDPPPTNYIGEYTSWQANDDTNHCRSGSDKTNRAHRHIKVADKKGKYRTFGHRGTEYGESTHNTEEDEWGDSQFQPSLSITHSAICVGVNSY